jgi:AcrR family transcriptional regulator
MDIRVNRKHKVDKAKAIIEAAQRRFGIYGIEKTSMREIADDVNLSKGSLYYYFPDKENLYTAVIQREQSEFLINLEESLKNITDSSDCLRKFALTRLSYFRAMLNLSRMRSESLSDYRPLVANSFYDFREKEKKIVVNIMEMGIKSRQFNIENPDDTASLFLDLLRSLGSVTLNNKKLLIINEDEFKILSKKTKDFTSLFIKGLRYRETK